MFKSLVKNSASCTRLYGLQGALMHHLVEIALGSLWCQTGKNKEKKKNVYIVHTPTLFSVSWSASFICSY